ncbi:hypothetical protein BKH42_03475 [Helicobacter sp. 13S00482-2]|uniref:ParM/StbA family protein n=1 Tax=Helicobacter sp. 13S00482-2 TaxID=1476200 RepID=UPI000BA7D5DE|nr:ParM/StbA family protein [Helicobacter sp. 13S00482-2]PAF53801.1 hypothetical protein BKH42_03475 [Helicobacter sp. 13S00482-2]
MLIGIDTGFGHTKYAFRNKDGGFKLGKFPSVLALTDEVIDEFNKNIFLFNGQSYYIGDIALKQDLKRIKEVNTYKELEKYAPLLIGKTLQLENLSPQKIEVITLGLAPAHINQVENFRKKISSFSLNKKDYSFKKTLIIPQGFGATIALKYFWKEQDKKEYDNYIVIDIGFNTIDTIIIYDREIDKSRLNENNSFEKRGVVRIAEMMQNHIREHFNKEITLKEALAVILCGEYKLRGQIHQLNKVVTDFKNSYTKDTMLFLEQKYGNEFDKLDAICFVGGGGYFINKEYASSIQTFKNSEYFNAIGNLITSEERK